MVGSLFIEDDDPGFIDLTILQPGATPATPIVSFTDGEWPETVLTGFTIRDGSAVRGAGVYCGHSFPSILHNRFLSSHANEARGDYIGMSPDPTDVSADPEYCPDLDKAYWICETSPCVGGGSGGYDIGRYGVDCFRTPNVIFCDNLNDQNADGWSEEVQGDGGWQVDGRARRFRVPGDP